jgi:hypothetical protein
MARRWLSALVLFALCTSSAVAQSPDPILGIRLSAVPDLLYDQVPQLKRGQGVAIADVAPGSAAARAGLRRNDIVLSCAGQAVRDTEHLNQLLRSDLPTRRVALVLLRAGKTMPLDVALDGARAALKPLGPPAVDVQAQRLEGDKLRVTFKYYAQGTGKLQEVTCTGSLGEIENEVHQRGQLHGMSARVQDLVEVALRRIRDLDVPASN